MSKLNNFQKFAKKAFYTKLDTPKEKLLYLVTAINEEAGEVAGEIKKATRNDLGNITAERKEKIQFELGDLLYYMAMLAETIDTTLEKCIEMEIGKLEKHHKDFEKKTGQKFSKKTMEKYIASNFKSSKKKSN